jgi:hypothetical protein
MPVKIYQPLSGSRAYFDSDKAERFDGRSASDPRSPWGINTIDLYHTPDGLWIAEERFINPELRVVNAWKPSIPIRCYEITPGDAAEWFDRQGIDPPASLVKLLMSGTRAVVPTTRDEGRTSAGREPLEEKIQGEIQTAVRAPGGRTGGTEGDQGITASRAAPTETPAGETTPASGTNDPASADTGRTPDETKPRVKAPPPPPSTEIDYEAGYLALVAAQ